MNTREDLSKLISGDVTDDAETLKKHSRDTSIFERKPSLVVFPKSADDVAAVVTYARNAKQSGTDISITARAAGTCMSGGPLGDSIILSFTKYMNRMIDIGRCRHWHPTEWLERRGLVTLDPMTCRTTVA